MLWHDVVGFENYYEVSAQGAFRRKAAGRGAVAGRTITTNRLNAKGYVVVEFSVKNTKARMFAHVAVAMAFLGPRPSPFHMVNHIDGNKQHNAIGNLEWCTAKENSQHASRIGLLRPNKGEANGRSKLTGHDVIAIRRLRGHVGQREIAKRFGVARSLIQRIHQGKAWKHLVG